MKSYLTCCSRPWNIYIDFELVLQEIILSQVFLLAFHNFIGQLSPVDLLNSRDKFRQAPPPDLRQVKFGEVEAYFGALITLYHIRRLLSSHGIRPAYEMLEEKLKQGYVLLQPLAPFLSV